MIHASLATTLLSVMTHNMSKMGLVSTLKKNFSLFCSITLRYISTQYFSTQQWTNLYTRSNKDFPWCSWNLQNSSIIWLGWLPFLHTSQVFRASMTSECLWLFWLSIQFRPSCQNSVMWQLQKFQASDTGIVNEPKHKALWFRNESRCQAVPEMKGQWITKNLFK